MKNKILVLTDFSENAFDAAVFACRVAEEQDYGIHLLHYYTVKSSHFDDEEDLPMRENSKLLKADLEILDLFGKLEHLFPEVKITISCKRGMLEEKLPKVLKEEKFVMIIMGAKGVSEHQSVFWGTTTAMITEKSSIPVWVVPKGFDKYDNDKIGLLTNFKAEELETLKKFILANGPIQTLTLLHVTKKKENIEEISEKMDAWIFNIQDWEEIGNVEYKIGTIDESDENLDTIPEVINIMINQNEIKCILVTKTRRSFFKRLFEKSISKTLTTQLVTPSFFDK